MRAWRLGRGCRRKREEGKHGRPLSIWDWASEQHLPGATRTLGIMLLSSKKDLKIAPEFFAIFHWALSILVIGETLAFGRVTICVCLGLRVFRV